MIDRGIEEYLNSLKSAGLLRALSRNDGIDFSSNDYLGLAHNTESLNAGILAAQQFGTGSTGSRLLSGNHAIFSEFEFEIAQTLKFEDSLIFNSGYVANLSVLSSFVAMDYLIIFDKSNHASMYHGAQNGRLERFNHANYERLESILKNNRDNPKKLIVSETVFGMDGDIADVTRLAYLAKKYNAVLYLDEAHATGLYGKDGYGIASECELDTHSTIIMGTFSKALASNGAYVACSSKFKNYLIQVSKAFIYSTALSPFSIGVARYNWLNLPKFENIRKNVFEKSKCAIGLLQNRKIYYFSHGTNIILLPYSSTCEMLDAHRKMLSQGIVAGAIRRPTAHTPRIRISINANHSYEDINLLVNSLL